MQTTNFKIKNRMIDILNEISYTGKLNVDTFKFEFDEEWNGLDKTLVIIVNDKTYNVALLNDEAILPIEAYENDENVLIGVFGKNDNTILSTDLTSVWIKKSAYIEGQEPSNLPTPTQWDLYISEINNLLSESKVSEEECKKALVEIESYRIEIRGIVYSFEKNAEEKTTNFDNHVAEKMKEFKAFSDGITVITSGTDDLIEGVSELPAGSMYLVYKPAEKEVKQDA